MATTAIKPIRVDMRSPRRAQSILLGHISHLYVLTVDYPARIHSLHKASKLACEVPFDVDAGTRWQCRTVRCHRRMKRFSSHFLLPLLLLPQRKVLEGHFDFGRWRG